MIVVDEGEAFFVSEEQIRSFLVAREAGLDTEIYQYGIGAGAPGSAEVFADVTTLTPAEASTLLVKLDVREAALRAA